jgi:excinuclease ABC subunit A
VDVDVPLGKLVVVCGVSGSGKSSFAFDTLFAEGQRRYIESFAPKIRQLLPRPDRPPYDVLDSLPAAIAIQRGNRLRNVRATVGTITELDDSLRRIFAEMGRLYCPSCGQHIARQDTASVVDRLAMIPRSRALIAFETSWSNDTELALQLADFQQAGFVRYIIAEKTINLDAVERNDLGRTFGNQRSGLVVVDRIQTGESTARTFESVETAFDFGENRLIVLVECSGRKNSASDAARPPNLVEVDELLFEQHSFSRNLECRTCRREYPIPEPNTFHFNSPLGACPECDGTGLVPVKSGNQSTSCRACDGSRLSELGRSYRIEEQSITDIRKLSLQRFADWFSRTLSHETVKDSYRESLETFLSRLNYLQTVGLGYLSLDRRAVTLSGGEASRVGLTGLLGSSLIDMLYVLDEPTVGLHPHDTQSLLRVITNLRDRGNTVLLVEHEPELMKHGDWLIEFGPQAGQYGGRVCFAGGFQGLTKSDSPTGSYFRKSAHSPSKADKIADVDEVFSRGFLQLEEATGRNLKRLSIRIPLERFTVVTGVSGSGKSSLIMDTLVPAVQRWLNDETLDRSLSYDSFSIQTNLPSTSSTAIKASPMNQGSQRENRGPSSCVVLGTVPPAHSSRSSPATYTQIFDELRKLFASSPDAKRLDWTSSHFSYNSSQGQCVRCAGDGRLVIDMSFMTDIDTECPDCRGSGYRHEVLSVKYRDRSIAECLSMSVDDAQRFFRGQPKLQKKLTKLSDLGLGYLPIGRRLSTLSSGELQRLKLANHLMESDSASLFVMDEPTSGLHFVDVEQLIRLIRNLTRSGNTVIVIEHNVALIEAADYAIDLGPGPGELGGEIIAEGTPRQIAANRNSLTGRYLFRDQLH